VRAAGSTDMGCQYLANGEILQAKHVTEVAEVSCRREALDLGPVAEVDEIQAERRARREMVPNLAATSQPSTATDSSTGTIAVRDCRERPHH